MKLIDLRQGRRPDKTNVLLIGDRALRFARLLDDGVGTRSTVMTSQLPVVHRHEYLGEPKLSGQVHRRGWSCPSECALARMDMTAGMKNGAK